MVAVYIQRLCPKISPPDQGCLPLALRRSNLHIYASYTK